MIQDVRYAARLLAKSPAFTALALCTLGLGIGMNTAIFTVANALLLRPLPYAHPDRLVLISTADPTLGSTIGAFSYPRWEFLREHSRSFSGMAAFTNESFNLTRRGEPEQVPSARVSGAFFDVLGVRPALGRGFLPEEDHPGAKNVALISHSLWMRRFDGDPNIVGQSVTLDSRSYTIIGVTPPGFQFAPLGATVDVWAPRVSELNIAVPAQIQRGARYLNAVARLADHSGIDQAQAEMNVLNQQYLRDFPKVADANPKLEMIAANLQEQVVANIRPALLILFGAVGLVLLIACANVASLLLSKGAGRKKEIAVRAALGASRGALVRQLMIESALLALLGGCFGVLLSLWATKTLVGLAEGYLPSGDAVGIDGSVLAFSLATSLLTGLIFGLAPVLQISRADLNSGLREEGRGGTSSRSRQRFRAALVVAQVALSIVLLIGAGLLARSFGRLLNTSPGVDASNVLTMQIALPPTKYEANHRMVAFFNELVTRMEHTPGVQSAAVASALPVNPTRFSPVLPEGQPPAPLPERPVVVIQLISPRYFETMRTPLLLGRRFEDRDDDERPLVVIVNQTFVRRFWPNGNPLDKHIWLGSIEKPVEVVGVAADIKNVSMAADPSPEIYVPYPQRPWRSMNLVIRTAGDAHTLAGAARSQVLAIDHDQPVTAVRTLEEVLATSRAQPRLILFLLGTFSVTAFVLAIVGLYGSISYSVAQRTQELGIRIALGADAEDILSVVIRQGMMLTLIGVAIGFAAALALTRVMSSMLYKMSATDPLTFLLTGIGFAAVALIASYLPARRATRVDPMIALR